MISRMCVPYRVQRFHPDTAIDTGCTFLKQSILGLSP